MAIKRFYTQQGLIIQYDDLYYTLNPYSSEYKTQNDDPNWDIVQLSTMESVVKGYNGIGIMFNKVTGMTSGSLLGIPLVQLPSS